MSSYVIFVDDSKQDTQPYFRNRHSDPPLKLQSYGGLICPSDALADLSWKLRELCAGTGLRENDEIKWTPKKATRFRSLDPDLRQQLQSEIPAVLADHDVQLLQSISSSVADDELDRASLTRFLEEAIRSAVDSDVRISFVFDLPSGGPGKMMNRFIAYLYEKVCSPLHSSPRVGFEMCGVSAHSRLLQAADFATSCFLAYVAGDLRYSPKYIDHFIGLLPEETGPWSNGGVWIGEDPESVDAISAIIAEAREN